MTSDRPSADLTDEELGHRWHADGAELERRATLASEMTRLREIQREAQSARGVTRNPGGPFTTPQGLEDAYGLGDEVTDGGKRWLSEIPYNLSRPGGPGWRLVE